MNGKALIGFDFSMSKPAMAILLNNNLYFYVWPAKVDQKTEVMLNDANVIVRNRMLPEIHTKEMSENDLICEHVSRAVNLAKIILDDISTLLRENNIKPENVMIANEGLAFSASGNVTLDLSGYKYILMEHLIQAGFTNLRTYSPITIKSTAGCAKKGMGKEDMINKLKEENQIHTFISTLANDSSALKKKTAYVKCVDDICDAYWCLKTLAKKENVNCILSE